jgi:hypothetical protein
MNTLAAQMRAQAREWRSQAAVSRDLTRKDAGNFPGALTNAARWEECAATLDAFADAAEKLERQHFDATHWLSVRLNDLRVKLDAADRALRQAQDTAAAAASAREAFLAARLEEQAQHSMALVAEGAVLVAALTEIEAATRNVNTRRSQRSVRIHDLASTALSAAPERARALAGLAEQVLAAQDYPTIDQLAWRLARAVLGMEVGDAD